MIFLDSNIIIDLMGKKTPLIRVKYKEAVASGVGIGVSSIVLFEFYFGIALSERRRENTILLDAFLAGPINTVAFEPEDAVIAGEIRAGLKAKGTPIGPYDILIAAHALRHNAILATANVREFKRVPGLKIENWGR